MIFLNLLQTNKHQLIIYYTLLLRIQTVRTSHILISYLLSLPSSSFLRSCFVQPGGPPPLSAGKSNAKKQLQQIIYELLSDFRLQEEAYSLEFLSHLEVKNAGEFETAKSLPANVPVVTKEEFIRQLDLWIQKQLKNKVETV